MLKRNKHIIAVCGVIFLLVFVFSKVFVTTDTQTQETSKIPIIKKCPNVNDSLFHLTDRYYAVHTEDNTFSYRQSYLTGNKLKQGGCKVEYNPKKSQFKILFAGDLRYDFVLEKNDSNHIDSLLSILKTYKKWNKVACKENVRYNQNIKIIEDGKDIAHKYVEYKNTAKGRQELSGGLNCKFYSEYSRDNYLILETANDSAKNSSLFFDETHVSKLENILKNKAKLIDIAKVKFYNESKFN